MDRTKHGLILQYRIQGNNRLHIPREFWNGHPLLRTRTYPKTQRKSHCNRCFVYIYENILSPKSCDVEGNIELLILITTTPSARHRRQAMRKTWLSQTKNNTVSVRYIFLIGSGWPQNQEYDIKSENSNYGDILQDGYTDSYYNLTLKVLSGFRFVQTNCTRAKNVMRTSDDNYVNIPNILNFLRNLKMRNDDKVIFGHCHENATVIRDQTSKWAVTKNEWAEDYYPPYCTGTALFMPKQTMEKLYMAAENVTYFALEDVYFGQVAKEIGVRLEHTIHMIFPMKLRSDSHYHQCKTNREWKAIHDVSPKDQYQIWKICQHKKGIL